MWSKWASLGTDELAILSELPGDGHDGILTSNMGNIISREDHVNRMRYNTMIHLYNIHICMHV